MPEDVNKNFDYRICPEPFPRKNDYHISLSRNHHRNELAERILLALIGSANYAGMSKAQLAHNAVDVAETLLDELERRDLEAKIQTHIGDEPKMERP